MPISDRVRTSPQWYARVAGLLYLYIVAAGTFAEVFVRSRLIVAGDVSATAQNIRANEVLLRFAFSAEFLHLACDVVVTVVLYVLLEAVDRTVALVTAFMRFACIVILAGVGVSQFAALRLLTGATHSAGLGTEQLHSLAYVAMQLHGDGYGISLMFFGFGCISLGYLIIRSTFLPRTIGILMVIAGICYLTNSFAGFLRLAIAGLPALFVPIFVAELALSMWLLVKGVNVPKFENVIASRTAID